MKPSIFIASSREGLDIAYAIQTNLDDDADVTVWTQGIFDLSYSSLETLVNSLDHFDHGLFVFSPDDILIARGKEVNKVRDNVIFELGLFIGRYGKERNFIIAPQGGNLHFPTDLLGVSPLTYNPNRSDMNLMAALGPACHKIRNFLKHRRVEVIKENWENFLGYVKEHKYWMAHALRMAVNIEVSVSGKVLVEFESDDYYKMLNEPDHHEKIEELFRGYYQYNDITIGFRTKKSLPIAD